MKIQLMSDIHYPFSHRDLPKLSDEADLLVIAGDIHHKVEECYRCFDKILECSSIPVVFVLGNHDYYTREFDSTPDDFKKFFSNFPNIHFLEKDSFEFGGYTFLGTTLWSDISNHSARSVIKNGITDYHAIKKIQNGKIFGIDPVDTHLEHLIAKEFLNSHIKEGEKTIVITHHLPSFECVAHKFLGSSFNAAFASPTLDTFELNPKLWLFGHTHNFVDKMIGNTRCVCNPYGYPGECYLEYRKEFIIEVE